MNKIKVPCRLCTKDGRKIGNAFCYLDGRIDHNKGYYIETDFGNRVVLTAREIKELFYVMKDEVTYDSWRKGKK